MGDVGGMWALGNVGVMCAVGVVDLMWPVGVVDLMWGVGGGGGGWRCPLFQEHSPRQAYHALCTLSFLPMGPVSPEPRVNWGSGCLLTYRLLSAHTSRRILITK